MNTPGDKLIFKDRQEKALHLVYGTVKSMMDVPVEVTKEDFFVVWFCKTLQNWKCLISAKFDGAPYVEVTYNGDKKETYVDVYRKIENVRFPD